MPIMARPVFDYLSNRGGCTGISINEADLPDGLLKIIVRKVGGSCIFSCSVDCTCFIITGGVICLYSSIGVYKYVL